MVTWLRKAAGQAQSLSPEVISAAILVKMRGVAEMYLGKEVNDAVVTAPAYSSDSNVRLPRKQEYCRAQHGAIISELTAAAMACHLDRLH